MQRFTAELGGIFKVKSTVGKFGVEEARGTPASSGMPTLSLSGWAANFRGGGRYVEFPVPETVWALMWTATMTRPDIARAVRAVAKFWNPGLAQY